MTNDRSNPRFGPRQGALTAVASLAIIAVWMTWWKINRFRSDSFKTSQVKSISMALRAYHESTGSYPPLYTSDEHGARMHSWRVLILPHWPYNTEPGKLFSRINLNKAWNSPENLGHLTAWNYSCQFGAGKRGATSYLAISTPSGEWLGGESESARTFHDPIVVVEYPGSITPWLEPADIRFDGVRCVLNSGSGRGEDVRLEGLRVFRLSGITERVPEKVSAKDLRALLMNR